MSQTEIKLVKPLKRSTSHPALLFRQSVRHTTPHTRTHTHTEPDNSPHLSISLHHHQFLPLLPQAFFFLSTFCLLSITIYLPLHLSPLFPPPLHLAYSLSSLLLSIYFPSFLSPTRCHLKPALYLFFIPFTNR